jgi:hypothetical protein
MGVPRTVEHAHVLHNIGDEQSGGAAARDCRQAQQTGPEQQEGTGFRRRRTRDHNSIAVLEYVLARNAIIRAGRQRVGTSVDKGAIHR